MADKEYLDLATAMLSQDMVLFALKNCTREGKITRFSLQYSTSWSTAFAPESLKKTNIIARTDAKIFDNDDIQFNASFVGPSIHEAKQAINQKSRTCANTVNANGFNVQVMEVPDGANFIDFRCASIPMSTQDLKL